MTDHRATHKIRTTLNDDVLTVDDAELADLKAQGLLREDAAPDRPKNQAPRAGQES